MGVYVSCQNQYYSGKKVVEVEAGGLDFAGPDMLCARYPGEGEEYTDPREAIEVAFRIRDAWRADAPEDEVEVAYGSTMGFGIEMEADDSDEELRARAAAAWEKLPKCDRCGEVYEEGSVWRLIDLPDEGSFCSENCADRAWEDYQRDTTVHLREEGRQGGACGESTHGDYSSEKADVTCQACLEDED